MELLGLDKKIKKKKNIKRFVLVLNFKEYVIFVESFENLTYSSY